MIANGKQSADLARKIAEAAVAVARREKLRADVAASILKPFPAGVPARERK